MRTALRFLTVGLAIGLACTITPTSTKAADPRIVASLAGPTTVISNGAAGTVGTFSNNTAVAGTDIPGKRSSITLHTEAAGMDATATNNLIFRFNISSDGSRTNQTTEGYWFQTNLLRTNATVIMEQTFLLNGTPLRDGGTLYWDGLQFTSTNSTWATNVKAKVIYSD